MTGPRNILELFIPEMAVEVPDEHLPAFKSVLSAAAKAGKLPKNASGWVPRGRKAKGTEPPKDGEKKGKGYGEYDLLTHDPEETDDGPELPANWDRKKNQLAPELPAPKSANFSADEFGDDDGPQTNWDALNDPEAGEVKAWPGFGAVKPLAGRKGPDEPKAGDWNSLRSFYGLDKGNQGAKASGVTKGATDDGGDTDVYDPKLATRSGSATDAQPPRKDLDPAAKRRPGIAGAAAGAAKAAKGGLSRFFQRHLGNGEPTPSWAKHDPGGTGSTRKPGEADPDRKYPVHKSARK